MAYDDYDLFIREARDALGGTVTALHDCRTLQPHLLTDPNGNRSEVSFDALGMVVGTAVMGKNSEVKGDTLFGLTADLDEAAALAELDDPLGDPHAILQRATTRIVYDVFAYQRTRDEVQPQPAVVHTLTRETHDADLAAGEQTRVQHRFSYSDGFGRQVQTKIQAEPGPLTPGNADASPRWVGSGWTIFNNKGNPVRKYEPFFTSTHRFEFARREGVSAVVFYDPVGRTLATLHPNHTWEKVVFSAWRQEHWDVNDTVLIADPKDDLNVVDYFRRLPDAEYLPGWHAPRAAGTMGPFEQAAAAKAAVHATTPGIVHLDSLGRPFQTVAHNRYTYSDSAPAEAPEEAYYTTRVVLDIEGNRRDVIDALDRIAIHYDYDMLGNRIHSVSADAGARWTLNDVAGKALYSWDSRDHRLRTQHDVLGRPIGVHLQTGSGPELLVAKTVFGETLTNAEANNLRGKPYQAFDGAGVVLTAHYDFKGNALSSSRQLAVDYTTLPDWSTTLALDTEVFTTRASFDALNRPITHTTPDNSTIRRTYNEANLLDTVDANLRGETVNGQLVWRPYVTDIDYDANGRRKRLAYGGGVVTMFDYDALTFRLIRLQTLRGGQRVQDLSYTYDPVGNITHIEDGVQQTIYFRNTPVTPSNDYLYDATYQLIEATGRQHLGQVDGQPNAPTPPDAFNDFHRNLDHPADGKAMGRYLERYAYDAVGNLLEMRHIGSDPVHPGWTRTYDYEEDSALDTGRKSNRLTRTTVGNGLNHVEPYEHDAHGSIASMPHLSLMRWNHLDQLEASARQVADSVSAVTTHYVYDGGGQRVRKVTTQAAGTDATPTRRNERIYVDGFETYREYDATGSTVTLERQALHLADDKQRVALVETRTQGNDGSPAQLTRYQIANHLGSSSLELDDAGRIISYEEYSPYGSTTYQGVDRSITSVDKRYRYSSKERDEETGLGYHGARYYLPWIGRWASVDPLFSESPHASPYMGLGNNPVMFVDRDGRQLTAMERTIERNNREFMTGQITERELKDRQIAQAAGVGIGGTIAFAPFAAWLLPELGTGGLGTDRAAPSVGRVGRSPGDWLRRSQSRRFSQHSWTRRRCRESHETEHQAPATRW